MVGHRLNKVCARKESNDRSPFYIGVVLNKIDAGPFSEEDDSGPSFRA